MFEEFHVPRVGMSRHTHNLSDFLYVLSTVIFFETPAVRSGHGEELRLWDHHISKDASFVADMWLVALIVVCVLPRVLWSLRKSYKQFPVPQRENPHEVLKLNKRVYLVLGRYIQRVRIIDQCYQPASNRLICLSVVLFQRLLIHIHWLSGNSTLCVIASSVILAVLLASELPGIQGNVYTTQLKQEQ